MDGTVLTGTTASLVIAERTGTSAELHELEAQFADGELTTVEFAHGLFGLWQTLDEQTVREAFGQAPWINNMDKVVQDIESRGETAIVITMSPNFFADLLLDWGFHAVEASVFPPLPFARALDERGILTPESKPRIVARYATSLRLDLDECVAYGDSMSDGPLFDMLPHTVAVNASEALEKAAAVTYRGDDLLVAYKSGRALL